MKLDLSRWSERQREAILARGQNVLVSAGAGSGKTSVLVERVVQCIAGPNPTDLQRMLIVTFTEAAAAEMRNRISDRLQSMYQAAVSSGDEAEARLLLQQLGQVEQAQISTLHSFCMQVVRRNFLHLGLEPSFDLMTEDDQVVLRAEIVDEVLEEWLSGNGNPAFLNTMRRFGDGQPRTFSSLVLRLYEFARSQPSPEDWLSDMASRFDAAVHQPFSELPWTPAFLQWVTRHLQSAQHLFSSASEMASGSEELQSYADNISALLEITVNAIAYIRSGAGTSSAAEQLNRVRELKTPRAKDHPLKDTVQDKRTAGLKLMQKVSEVLQRGEDRLCGDIVELAPDVNLLAKFVIEFSNRYQAAKLSRGMLDFNDLEHFALQALRDSASGEAFRLQDFFVEVFVDEYQDTSPIQDALVNAITRKEGNVFVVGDVKQSIYRFRMAEPNLFLQKYNNLGVTAPGKVIDLSTNYRSRAEVVGAVNFVFEQLFSSEFGGITYDERAKMAVGANYGTDGGQRDLAGPVEIHIVSRDEDDDSDDALSSEIDSDPVTPEIDVEAVSGVEPTDESAAELSAMEKEAMVVGERILSLMGRSSGSERAQVWDAKAGAHRPLQYRDIVVLLRSVKTRMNPLLEVLRKLEIPAYGATSTGFYGAVEVQWLLSALTAVDNPRREIDFVALLRSPIARFTDEELALIRLAQKGNYFEAMQAVCKNPVETIWPENMSHPSRLSDLQVKVKAFMDQFRVWRRLARRANTEDVLRRIVEDSDFVAYVSGMAGGDVRRANVRVLLDKTRAFDRTSYDGVFGFVTQARTALEHEVDTGEARTLGESEDVVRVMTIHQSKGLEYPVVFVADVGKMFYRNPAEKAFPLHRVLGFGPQFVDADGDQRWPTLSSIAIEELELTEFLAEEARVLYVAMTRARERLILVGSSRQLPTLVERAYEAIDHTTPTLNAAAMLGAKSYLDWLLPAVLRHRDGQHLKTITSQDSAAVFRADGFWDYDCKFAVHLWNTPAGHTLPALPQEQTKLPFQLHGVRNAADLTHLLQTLDALAAAQVPVAEAATAHSPFVEARRAAEAPVQPVFVEPAPSSTTPGKVSATELRRLWVANERSQHAAKRRHPSVLHAASAEPLLEDPVFARSEGTTARESGIAFHAVMQRIGLTTEPTAPAVQHALDNLVAKGHLLPEQAQAVDVQQVVAFLASPIGQRLAGAKRVLREQPFFKRIPVGLGTAREAAAGTGDVGPVASGVTTGGGKTAGGLANDAQPFVIAQGVIDCLAEDDKGWLLVDYKTDNIDAEHADEKAEEYAAQVAVYLDAAKTALGVSHVDAYLYFVKPQVVVPMGTVDYARLFRG